jgi:predicted dehydrogenase
MSQVRFGIVGIGFGQHALVPALRADERANLVAIAASGLDRAAAVAQRHAIPEAYGGWEDLVARSLDAICICVPPSLQPAIAIAAVESGKSIFCEKPLAVDLAGAQAMLRAARAAGATHMVDLEFRELDVFQRTRDLVRSGQVGDVRNVAVSWRVETMAWSSERETWKRRSADGGGALNLFGSHCLDYLEWMFGPIERVLARLEPRSGPADARVDAWMETSRGATISLSIAVDAYLGTGHRVEIYGEEGSIVLENVSRDHLGGFTLSTGIKPNLTMERIVEAIESNGEGRVRTVTAGIGRFIDSMLEGKQPEPNLTHGLRIQELMEMMRESDKQGTWQTSIS